MFRKLAEGDVFCNYKEAACGPRLATLPDGRLMCSFMLHRETGSNDFYPMAAYSDDGINWSEAKPVWPALVDKESVFVSARTTLDGRVSMAGKVFPIGQLGESFWSSEVGGMKENKLTWAVSEDGYTWPAPNKLDLPYYGSAEQPGGMLVDRDGTIFMVYAPYRAAEMKHDTDTCQLVLMKSTDGGKTFKPTCFGRQPAPCQYGETFSGPYAMPFRGQTTALESWDDGTVLIVYNQRKEAPTGVWLALAKPEGGEFHMLENQPVWETLTTTQHGSSGDFNEFTDFAFGEPHVMVLGDQSLLVTLWYRHGERRGIRYVLLRREM